MIIYNASEKKLLILMGNEGNAEPDATIEINSKERKLISDEFNKISINEV